MKKWLALGVLGVAALAAFAATCTVTKVSLTNVDGKDVFAGQLNNDSGADLLQHRIIVAFLDSANNVVETKTVEGCKRSLQAGETDYFSVQSSRPTSETTTGLARLALDSNLKAGETEDSDFALSNVVVRRDDAKLKVTGTIKNNDDEELEDPKACVVVLDENDNIVFVAKTTNLADLDEGDEVDFTITVDVVDDGDILNTVHVFADGLEDGVPTDAEEDLDNTVTDCSDATSTPTKTATPTGTATATNTPLPTNTPGGPANTATNTATATATPCF